MKISIRKPAKSDSETSPRFSVLHPTKIFLIIFTLFSLLGSLLLAVTPVEVRQIEKFYSSNELKIAKPILLTADVPDSLRVTFSNIVSAPDGILLSTSNVEQANSILVVKKNETIEFGFSMNQSTEPSFESKRELSLQALDECSLVLEFAEAKLSLLCGEIPLDSIDYASTELGPIMTHLYSPFGDAVLVTKPAVVSPSEFRESLKYWTLAALAIGIFLQLLQVRNLTSSINPLRIVRQKNRVRSRTMSLQEKAVDLFVAIYIFVSGVVAWPMDDDGNVLATVNSIKDVGGLSNYYSVSAGFQPTGNLPYQLLQDFWSGAESLLELRLPHLLAAVFTWLFVRKTLNVLIDDRKIRIIAIFASAIFFSSATLGFISIRPEPFVALCFSIALWFTSLILIKGDSHRGIIIHLGGLAALSLLIHQSGLVVVGLFLAVLILNYKLTELINLLKERATQTALWVASLTVTTFWVGDFGTLYGWARGFSSQSTHSKPLIDEFGRYFYALGQLDIRSLPILWLIIFILLVPMLISNLNSKIRLGLFTFVSFFGLAFLAFTPSKWVWHLGAVTPLIGVLGGIFVYLLIKGSSQFLILSSVVFVIPTVSLSLISYGKSALANLPLIFSEAHSVIYGQRSQVISGSVFSLTSGSLLLITIFVSILFFAGLWAWLRGGHAVKVAAVTLLPLFLLSTSAPLMLVSAVRSDSFGPGRMNIDFAESSNSCGVLDRVNITIPNGNLGSPAFTTLSTTPLLLERNELGSQSIFETSSRIYEFSISNIGDFTQEAMLNTGNTPLGSNNGGKALFLKASASNPGISISSISGDRLLDLNDDYWVPLNLKEFGSEIKLRIEPKTVVRFHSTDILSFESSTASEYFNSKQIRQAVLDPQLALLTPCLRPPGISEGVFGQASFAVSDLNYADLGQFPRLDVGQKYLKEHEVFEVGCPASMEGRPDLSVYTSMCIYHLGEWSQ